ncbi:hypothetical protein DEO72_LG1g556 [Vigna unguiculata]|uniref:Uncharacterized protein n=1 Tax=Vigna unguiculata TaxID=3917 RepID=A0A4D6KJV8_VIGUN|nr:hypothetical protein DEO72_LG1g556 [Vigna unguiculata]
MARWQRVGGPRAFFSLAEEENQGLEMNGRRRGRRRRLESLITVSGKRALAAVKGSGVVLWSREEEAAPISRWGRRKRRMCRCRLSSWR